MIEMYVNKMTADLGLDKAQQDALRKHFNEILVDMQLGKIPKGASEDEMLKRYATFLSEEQFAKVKSEFDENKKSQQRIKNEQEQRKLLGFKNKYKDLNLRDDQFNEIIRFYDDRHNIAKSNKLFSEAQRDQYQATFFKAILDEDQMLLAEKIHRNDFLKKKKQWIDNQHKKMESLSLKDEQLQAVFDFIYNTPEKTDDGRLIPFWEKADRDSEFYKSILTNEQYLIFKRNQATELEQQIDQVEKENNKKAKDLERIAKDVAYKKEHTLPELKAFKAKVMAIFDNDDQKEIAQMETQYATFVKDYANKLNKNHTRYYKSLAPNLEQINRHWVEVLEVAPDFGLFVRNRQDGQIMDFVNGLLKKYDEQLAEFKKELMDFIEAEKRKVLMEPEHQLISIISVSSEEDNFIKGFGMILCLNE